MTSPDHEAAVRAWAERQIPPDRLAHVHGVVETVTRLAECFAPACVAQARLAAWIHDVAKGWDDDALLRYAEAHALPITHTERAVPMLLHGAVGYALAAEQLGLADPAVESACRLHTTGAPGMSTLDKIVYVGDLIEPTRAFRGLKALRREAERDLDAATLRATDLLLKYLVRNGRIIDPRAVALHNQLIAAGVCYEKKRDKKHRPEG